VNTIFPESFAFFTKDPKDKQLELFNVTNGVIEKINIKTNALENKFGLSRVSRRKAYELGMVIQNIPDSIWQKVEGNKIPKLKLAKPYSIDRPNNLKLISNGQYLIYYYKPIEWEFNHLKTTSKGDYVYVEIK
jgi:antimicrobial peptide system SdpA family protein